MYQEDQDDIKKLIDFVSNTEKDIQLVIDNAEFLIPESQDLRTLVRGAWKDVKPRFPEIIDYLQRKRRLPQHLRDIRVELEERGLIGAQLKLKYRVYTLYREEFLQEWRQFQEAPAEEKKRKAGGVRGILGGFFDLLDDILDSLGVVPGSDAVKEIKHILLRIMRL